MNGEQICLICFSASQQKDIIIFESCKHTFCKMCSIQIIFKKQVICPIDKNNVINIQASSSFGMEDDCKYLKTIPEFRSSIFRNDIHLIMDAIESYWSRALTNMCKVINDVDFILQKSQLKIKKWLKIEGRIDEKEIQNFWNLHTDTYLDCRNLINNDFNDLDMFKILWKNIHEIEDEKIDWIQLQKWRTLVRYFDSVLLMLCNDFKYLQNPQGIQKEILRKMKHQVKANINHLENIQLFIRSIIISFGTDDRDIFTMVQSRMNKENTNKCVICVKQITSKKYGTFTECDHKLCLNCIHKFVLCKGRCPFHCNNESDMINFIECSSEFEIKLVNSSEGVTKYLTDNLQMITKGLNEEIENQCLQLRERIISHSAFKIFIGKFNKYPSKMDMRQTIENTLKNCSVKLKTVLKSFYNDEIVYYHDMAMSGFRMECVDWFSNKLTSQDKYIKEMKNYQNSLKRLMYEKEFYVMFLKNMYNLECYLWENHFNGDFEDLEKCTNEVMELIRSFIDEFGTFNLAYLNNEQRYLMAQGFYMSENDMPRKYITGDLLHEIRSKYYKYNKKSN